MSKQVKHEDTSISLQPLSFEEAIKTLAQSPKHEDSPAEASGNTKEPAPESEPKAQ